MLPEEDEPLDFIDQEPEPANADTAGAPWKLLIVDDDVEVHEATRFAIHNVRIAGRPLQLINARSGAEAAAILAADPEIAVILLDVVMESPNAGLDLVQRIRHEFGLTDVRIILRTGQPGHAPELKVIRDYDINDYKTKAELTHTRLVTALIAAIRSYDQLRTISENRRGLELIVTATPGLMQAQKLDSFANSALRLLMSLLDLRGDGIVCVQGSAADNGRPEALRIIAASGQLAAAIGQPLQQLKDPEIVTAVLDSMRRQAHCFAASHTALFLRGDHHQAVMLVRNEQPLTSVERQLLEIFAANLFSCFGNVMLVERLNYLAYHDPLTQLPNRTRFIEELSSAGPGAAQDQVVCMLDIDRFTDINNALGHAVGDQLLIALVKRLAQAYDDCHLARIGADTFGLIGPEALLAPERLLSLIQDEPFAAGDHQLQVTATIGLCRITGHENGDTLFNRADMAFTRARLNPHAGPLYFSQDMEERTHWRLDVLSHLRRDFHDGRLAVWFQPQMSLTDGGVVGLEALARWPTIRGFTQPPAVFIPLAEESGLIIDIGAWVLDQSCAMFSRLQASGHAPRRIAVNVSMPQMRQPDFPERVARTLAAHGMAASSLELEITESQLLDEPLVVLRNLHALKQEGIQISIDDFGTGYSSLGYLRQLPIDCVKIDRSFVLEIDNGKGDLFAETIITLAHKLGAETVAEGVDSPAQVQRLRQLGCDTAQGFLYARPMPAEELAGWIGQRALH